MTLVVAQGTFDILHPGHVHYLRAAKAYGDELHVIVARSSNVTHKPGPIIPDDQRREMVEYLDPVDHARLGHPEDIFVPIEELEPDVIVLGHDQYHEEADIRNALDSREIDCRVERAEKRAQTEGSELLSSGQIIQKIIEQRGN